MVRPSPEGEGTSKVDRQRPEDDPVQVAGSRTEDRSQRRCRRDGYTAHNGDASEQQTVYPHPPIIRSLSAPSPGG